MRRFGALGPVKVLAVLCTAMVVTVGEVAVPASSAQPGAGVTLTLVSPGPCTAPAKVVGRACLVSGHLLDPNWTLRDGSAQWNVPGQWQSSYTWKVPATIPPAGASMTMTLGAKELTGRPNNRICPAMGVAGGVELKVGGVSQAQPVQLGFCAEAGGSRSGTKTVKLVPSSAQPPGTFVYLVVGLTDGGEFTYRYRAGAQSCPKPKMFRGPSAVGQAPKCRYKVSWVFTQGGRRPAGMPKWVTDVATAGRGSGEVDRLADPLGDPIDLEKFNVRVVRTMEILRNEVDTGIAVGDVTLRFVAGGEVATFNTGNGFRIGVSLVLIASDDPLCTTDRSDGGESYLILVDGGDRGKDGMYLSVPGCPHHSAKFRGSIGPKSAVKVAIVVTSI